MMLPRRRVLMAGLGVTFAGGGCASARLDAQSGASDADIAALLAARVDVQRRGAGAVAGRVRGGGASFVAHGVARLDSAEPVSSESTFQIASLTKVFTALLYVDAARRGEIGLEDSLSRYLPARVPQFGRPISLLDLATHASGLGLRPPSRLDRSQDDPYAGYTRAELLTDIEAAQLTRAPGAAFEYSNFGYALLGEALARRFDRPYEDLVQSRIVAPLELSETKFDLAAVRPRLVQGYDREWRPMQPWDLGALAPAGGLFSTIGDLTKFLQLWTAPRGSLSRAAREMLTPRGPGDNAETRMGIGWRVVEKDGRTLAWSNGSGGGVRSFMGVQSGGRVGVAAFINMATGQGVDDIGMRALDPTYEVDVTPVPERGSIVVPPEVLARYVGVYRESPGNEIEIARGAEGLDLVLGRGARIPLLAESEALFYMRDENISLEFDARADVITVRQSGQVYRYVRVR